MLEKPFVQRVKHPNVSLAKWIGVLTKCIHSIRSSHRNSYGIQHKYNRIQFEVRGNLNNKIRWNKMENSIPKVFTCGWNGYMSFRNYFSSLRLPTSISATKTEQDKKKMLKKSTSYGAIHVAAVLSRKRAHEKKETSQRMWKVEPKIT